MWDVIGHEWAVEILHRQVTAGAISHAYLFCGPEGIGKKHLASTMAAALACCETSPPCDRCKSCQRVRTGEHPDVYVVRGVDDPISIESIRELRRFLTLSPFQAPHRLALLLDFENATAEASNALLKSLEEPPVRSVLILTATSPQAVLPTILSRCQVFHLRRIATVAIQEALETRHHVPADRASLLARLAGGSLSWAVAASGDVTLEERLARDVNHAIDLCHHGRAHRLAAAEKIAQREDLVQLLHSWATWWHDVLLTASGQERLVIHGDLRRELVSFAGAYGVGQAVEALHSIEDALEQIEHHVNPRLALEVMLLRWRRQRQPARN